MAKRKKPKAPWQRRPTFQDRIVTKRPRRGFWWEDRPEAQCETIATRGAEQEQAR